MWQLGCGLQAKKKQSCSNVLLDLEMQFTTSGVNFTNILQAAFMRADPKSAKKCSKIKQHFALLGSAGVKAARKHVDEIDPRSARNKVNNFF